jgi:hypothetical protein
MRIGERLGWRMYSPELEEDYNSVSMLFEEIPVKEKDLKVLEELGLDFVEEICSIIESYAKERYGRNLEEIGRIEIEPVDLCHGTFLGFEVNVSFCDPRIARIFKEEIKSYIKRKLSEKYSHHFT